MFDIILATDKNHGIGNTDDTQLPWKISEDLQHFFKITSSNGKQLNIIIMGRKTADTLKEPLKYRINIVLTSNSSYRQDEGFLSFNTIEKIIKFLQTVKFHKAFIIGGQQLVDKILEYPCYINNIYLTINFFILPS